MSADRRMSRILRPFLLGLAAWALLGSTGSGCASAEAVLPLSIEVRARAMWPGEPLRIEAVSRVPVASMEGAFLGRPVFMVRSASEPQGGERWSGWSMIGLDQDPGPAAVEIHGRTHTGQALGGTRAITIESHTFPVETLSVAPKYVEPPEEVRERLARERSKLAVIYEARRQTRPAQRAFLRPVPGEPTSVFGTRRVFNGQPRAPHPGLDLRAPSGTPVGSAGAGRVTLAEELYYAGNTVIVDHGGGLFTVYAHLSELHVGEGDELAAGDVLGLSGATGRVTGPHLHWGAKIGDLPFDPTALLDERLFFSKASSP